MLGGNNGNHMLPVFMGESSFQCNANASNQLQLFGNLPTAGCGVDPVNYFGNEHNTCVLQARKRGREAEDFTKRQKLHIPSTEVEEISRRQKLQFSLNYNISQDEADRSASLHIQNPVSTGLRLSYDDDEHNSSVTSSGSMTAAPSIILSLGDNIRAELDRQKEELDQYIKIQDQQLVKGVRDMKRRHMASFLAPIEKCVRKKLSEKDLEIESINSKNLELVERIKQAAVEAQNWHYRAKFNESVVNLLKNKLQHAISQGADHPKEGFGDSEVDDAASYIDPNNMLIPGGSGRPNSLNKGGSSKQPMVCRACKRKEVSVLLIPCRHLCVCTECEGSITVCPVCQSEKTSGLQVYLS